MGAWLDQNLLHGHQCVEPINLRFGATGALPPFTVFGHWRAAGARGEGTVALDLGQGFLAYLSF